MNIVQMLSRDVTDKQKRHFVLISIKLPKKSQDVRPPKPTNMLTLPNQQQGIKLLHKRKAVERDFQFFW